MKKSTIRREPCRLPKAPTGITGLDELLGGGVPRGRPTLVCGSAGCGKTLFGLEFLVRGARESGEPGVLISFEESARDLEANAASLGFDLPGLQRRKQLIVDSLHIDRSEITETGEYDLDGLFVRLGHAIDTIGAKRVVLDTIEVLFAGLSNHALLRSELRRLFRWLKDRGVTAVITGERGDGTLTRHGLEEYVSDCVILLDNRVEDQVTTRRLRVVKYRGSSHGTNEYPFLIGATGFCVLPITSAGLDHDAPTERMSSGVPALDEMLGGRGFYRASTVLVSGTAGTGKTSLAAHLVDAACRRGEKAIYFAFEESPDQILRNMRSIGLDLSPWVRKRLLTFHSARPTLAGLETHLAVVHSVVADQAPQVVVMDPITNFRNVGRHTDVRGMLVRMVDFLKLRGITAMFTSLSHDDIAADPVDVGISSIVDTWLLVRNIEAGGERNRALYVLKARGMAHSNKVREFVLTDQGVRLVDVCVAGETVLTGSARVAWQAFAETQMALSRGGSVPAVPARNGGPHA